MVEDDVQLIRKVLSGDDEAFTTLVRKHQKSVHALAWRRVGDFHAAEEITQDAFLRVYKHLPKLKHPRQFSGWLYVTTNRLCNTWLQENKPETESLEDVPVSEIERTSYEHYVSAQHEEDAHASRNELVKRLLEKLPESERTVMTLYYLGEMTSKEISRFLGVSVHTVTSRLQRARKRLQQDEELLVQETLGSVQLPESLTQKHRTESCRYETGAAFNRETVPAVAGFRCGCAFSDPLPVRGEQPIPRPVSKTL